MVLEGIVLGRVLAGVELVLEEIVPGRVLRGLELGLIGKYLILIIYLNPSFFFKEGVSTFFAFI